MEKLTLSKRTEIMIDDDLARVIRFNTEDVHLRARLFNLAKDAARKEKEVQAKAAEVEGLEGLDENGFPLQTDASVSLMVELADYFMAGLDDVFGEGTSAKVFAEGFDFASFTEFLSFVLGKFEAKSKQKINDCLNKPTGKKKALK